MEPVREKVVILTTKNKRNGMIFQFALITDFYSLEVKAAAPVAKDWIGKSLLDAIFYYKRTYNATIQILYINSLVQ